MAENKKKQEKLYVVYVCMENIININPLFAIIVRNKFSGFLRIFLIIEKETKIYML